jgi:hypothetical protein
MLPDEVHGSCRAFAPEKQGFSTFDLIARDLVGQPPPGLRGP